MISIKLEKIDELMLLVSELESIAYLQELMSADMYANSKGIEYCDKKYCGVNEYISHLNEDAVKRLSELVFGDDFVLVQEKFEFAEAK